MVTTKQIKEDRIQAMKDKNKLKVNTLRRLLSSIEKERIESLLDDLNEDQIITCISRELKVIDSEIEGLVTAGRDYEKPKEEEKILRAYLPAPLTTDEVLTRIGEVVAQTENMGQAMKILQPEFKGKADMKFVSATLKEAFKK